MYCIELKSTRDITERIGPFAGEEFNHVYRLLTKNGISVLDGRAGFKFPSDANLEEWDEDEDSLFDPKPEYYDYPTVEVFLESRNLPNFSEPFYTICIETTEEDYVRHARVGKYKTKEEAEKDIERHSPRYEGKFSVVKSLNYDYPSFSHYR